MTWFVREMTGWGIPFWHCDNNFLSYFRKKGKGIKNERKALLYAQKLGQKKFLPDGVYTSYFIQIPTLHQCG